MNDDERLREQLAYYRARAAEYDDWWFRRGRYDRGPATNARWFAEQAIARATLQSLGRVGHALDLACGTGLWTQQLAAQADRVTALDAAPEVLAVCRERLPEASVEYVTADLFTWEPEHEFDLVCLAFWLSHVPDERLDDFLSRVVRATRPGGAVFIVESRPDARSTARDHTLGDAAQGWQTRRLADGREFRVVKRFRGPDELGQHLARHGFTAEGRSTGDFFNLVHGTRR